MNDLLYRELVLSKKGYDSYEENESGGEEYDKGDGIFTFVISTPEIDRYGTIIVPSGINYDAYMKNPVVLANHKSTEFPVGKCLGFFMNGDNLEATIQLDMEDDEACKINRKLKNGFLNAVSVGIIPNGKAVEEKTIEGEPIVIYKESELVEFSVVTIPANRDALLKKSFQNQQTKAFLQILNQLKQEARMLTPEQMAAITDQLLPVIKEAALMFFKDELGIPEDLAAQAAESGTVAMAEAVLAVLSPEEAPAPPAEAPTAPATETPATPPATEVSASFEVRAGKKIAASTLSMIMDGLAMIEEGNKKVKKAVSIERGITINVPKIMTADDLLNNI
jgi:HK97 family phage prohead protease